MTHDPANWTLLEQYKELRAKRDQRQTKLRHWGSELTSVGYLLTSGVTTLDLSKLPEKTEISETQRDQVAYLERELRQKGMGEYL
jgi:hypothetical protein